MMADGQHQHAKTTRQPQDSQDRDRVLSNLQSALHVFMHNYYEQQNNPTTSDRSSNTTGINQLIYPQFNSI
jgi:hypothetical protein